jgi:KDO2-lipid IV(A) lauroyltransferase
VALNLRHLWRAIRHQLAFRLAQFILFLVRTIPRPFGLKFMSVLGRLLFHLMRKERQRTRAHLTLIFGERWSAERIERTARRVFVNVTKTLYDALYISGCDDAEFQRHVPVRELDELRRLHGQGRGLLAISGHIGCFELLTHVVARGGIPICTIGQKLFDERVDEIIGTMRSRNGITFMHRDGAGRDIIRNLRSGMVFGTLIDQDTDLEGVFAHFLGRLAYTPDAPVRLAMKLNVPVIVAWIVRNPDDTHSFHTTGEIALQTGGDFDQDLVANVEMVNAELSRIIEADPEQWVWMHRRWRRRPEDPKYAARPSATMRGNASRS